jgi:hypothetical protein
MIIVFKINYMKKKMDAKDHTSLVHVLIGLCAHMHTKKQLTFLFHDVAFMSSLLFGNDLFHLFHWPLLHVNSYYIISMYTISYTV